MDAQSALLKEKVTTAGEKWARFRAEVAKPVVGMDETIKKLTIALISEGHVLLEGVPGVAKTTLVKAFSDALGLTFSRIQFTPDLLPSDLLGTMIFNPATGSFSTKKGPIFANIVLADEINRAPPKVQSALLEAMQEKQVTIGDKTYEIDRPFMVLATQNPVEQEGTYKLPEAQVDRFLMKLLVGYLGFNDEKKILSVVFSDREVSPVISTEDISEARELVSQLYVDDKIVDYILRIVFATRFPEKYGIQKLQKAVEYGASPRASISLHLAARVNAFLSGRSFVIPDDVKEVAADILRHRVLLSYEAEAEGLTQDDVVEQILRSVPAP